MKYIIRALLALAVLAIAVSSCDDHKSYAELLADENIHSNDFLANQRVIGYEQRDSTFKFETGPDAPYYQLDEDANVFMQVLNPGTEGNRARYDQLIYFRFTRYNLNQYINGQLPSGDGNDVVMANTSASFKFSNMSYTTSYQWGYGLQMPLIYLPIDCEVNILIKSQYGLNSEIAAVVPYLYNVRYFKSQI